MIRINNLKVWDKSFNIFIKIKRMRVTIEVDNLEQYFKHYNKSVTWTTKILGKKLLKKISWYQQWDKVVDFNMVDAEIKIVLKLK
jgi:acetyl-CoA synthetase